MYDLLANLLVAVYASVSQARCGHESDIWKLQLYGGHNVIVRGDVIVSVMHPKNRIGERSRHSIYREPGGGVIAFLFDQHIDPFHDVR